MIRKLTIRRFKRFREETFTFPGHVVLAGPNNCGKTTVLQAIAAWNLAMMRWKQLNDYQRHRGAYTKAPITRQAFAAVPLRSFDLLWHDRDDHGPIEIEIQTDAWTIAMEFVPDTTEQLYVRPKPQAEPATVRRAGLTPVFVPAMSGIGTDEPVYQRPKIEQLLGQGKPGDVLRNILVEAHQTEPAWRGLQDGLRRLFSYELVPPDSSGADIIAEYQERARGPRLDIAGAGSGFQQVLMLLAFLHTRPGAVVLVDEPDAHLHVILQDVIFSELRAVAMRQHSQLVLATHSEVIINSADPGEICVLAGGPPRRIETKEERAHVVLAVKTLPQVDIAQAMTAAGVLYLDDDFSDLRILREWARILGHPAYAALLHKVLCRKAVWETRQGAAGIRARDHYEALKLVRPDLPAIQLQDRDARAEAPAAEVRPSGMQVLRWSRYEIESYLVHPAAIDRFLEQKVGAGAPSAEHRKAAREELQRLLPAAVLDDPLGDHPILQAMKASDDILLRVLRAAGLPEVDKSDLYQIAAVMAPEEIHPEVIEKLDAIRKAFGSAP